MDRKSRLLALAAVTLVALAGTAAADEARPLASAAVGAGGAAPAAGYDGVVQALRQTVVAGRSAATWLATHPKAGDRVKAGQVLLRLDARAAEQQAGAAAAQGQAARAAQGAATREFERQKQLHQNNYISQAALDRAEAQFKSAQAQAAAQLAAAGAARTESGFYTVKAPYDGIVSEVQVVLGDMAMPGRPLLTLYDPTALRVTVAVPQTAVPASEAKPLIELPGVAPARITPLRWQLLPAVDPATHTRELRLDLPTGTAATPGMFARAWLPGVAGDAPHLSVPLKAVVRRAELTAVYVVGADGRPLSRDYLIEVAIGDQVDVLAGLAAGEPRQADPQAAARVR